MKEARRRPRVLLATCPGPPDRCNPSSFYPSRFPLSIHSLKGALLAAFGERVEVTIYDWHAHGGEDDLVSMLRRGQHHVVGISVLLNQSRRLRRLLDRIHEAGLPAMPLIVLGNIYTTFHADNLQQAYPNVICIQGEGEYGLLDVVSQVMRGGPIDRTRIRGVASGVVITRPKDIGLPTTDTLPFHVGQKGIVQLETSRGCSWGVCSFCSRLKRGNTWRPIDTERVLATLRSYVENGVDLVIFSDEDFLGSGERGVELASAILKSDVRIAFHASMRVSSIFRMTDTIKQIEAKWNGLQLLKKAGLRKVFLGVESGAPTQLERYMKDSSVEENRMAIEILQASEIALSVGFIMFDPFVRVSELSENVHFLAEHRLLDRTYAFNRMCIPKGNGLMAGRIQEQGLVCGTPDPDGYFTWRFADDDVSRIYAFCSGWEERRSRVTTLYRELLADYAHELDASRAWKLRLLRRINRENMKADGKLIESLCAPGNVSEATWRNLARCLSMQRIEAIVALIDRVKREISAETVRSQGDFFRRLEQRIGEERLMSSVR